MPNVTIRPDRLRSHLEDLARIGADPAGGISRFPYSEVHAQAVGVVAGWMQEAGLQPGCDAFGNLVGTRPGEPGWPSILLGSHLDSVPHGGMFDGALGVLGGVEVAAALQDAGWPVRHGLAVVGFADEEGYAFGVGRLASRCLVGDVPHEQSAALHGRDGRTLAQAIAAFAPGLPRAAVPSQAGAYLELHIEQGPVLAQMGWHVAAISAISGLARTTVVLEGEANHAGTTPMASRRDALVGAAEVILAVKGLAEVAGAPAVGTVGTLAVLPGASNVIPGRCEFRIEFRAHDGGQLRRLCEEVETVIRQTAARRSLVHHVAPWDVQMPAPMDAGILEAIVAAIAAAGHHPHTVPSGAGHDAMILAPYVPAGMIFVPSVGGISHSPREQTAWEDVALGADVLLRTVMLLDRRGPLPVRVLPITSP